MKKKFYFATLVIALLSFTGCANDEYVGDQQNLGEQNGAIAFSTKSENTVRGESRDDVAAGKLNRQFWVYGTKKVTVDNIVKDQPVFNNYKVTYSNGTSSPSNTKGWEYVGIEDNQTIKYWDYSASQYDFEAYSISGAAGTGTVERIANNNNSGNGLNEGDYKVEGINQNGCANLYFADKMTVPPGNNQKAVELKFKSVLSKIRVGFYETIPGYSVKIDGFYPPNNTPSTDATGFVDAGNRNTGQFVAWCPNKEVNIEHPFAVSYDTYGNPAVTKVAKTTNPYYAIDGSAVEYKLDAQLTLGTNLLTQGKIGETYSVVTWDNIDINNKSLYTYFIPQEGNSQVQPMKIKVDYTLTSDKDDSGEKIVVKGATAIVPAEYLSWKANTAYSYVFKISDNTNGTTGGEGDPAGLYPITFDAVVEDMAEYKDHLTTVSELSITATQGKQFAEADKAVFKTGQDKPIKVKVMYNNVDITSTLGSTTTDADKLEAAFVDNYNYDLSPEQNLPSGTSLQEKTIDSSVITLGSQTNAGYWIVKVTYNDKGTNITKYAVLKVG